MGTCGSRFCRAFFIKSAVFQRNGVISRMECDVEQPRQGQRGKRENTKSKINEQTKL